MPPRAKPPLALNEREPGRTNKASIFQRLEPGERLYDSEVGGLYLQAGRRGRTYHVVAQSGARQVRRALGKAQTPSGVAGALSVDAARAAARQVIDAVVAGIPPETARRRAERQAAHAAASTFAAVAAEYFSLPKEQGGGANLRSLAEAERKVRVDLAEWTHRPIASISRREIRALLREKGRTAPAAANRLQSLVCRIFKFAAAEDYIEALPVVALGKNPEPTLRERHLDRRELRLVWQAAGEMEPYGRIVRLLLTTAQRRGEIGALRRSEVGVLTYREPDPIRGKEKIVEAAALLLPAARMKGNRPHTVPLSWLAERLIDETPKPKDDDGEELELDFLFATGRRGDEAPSGWSRWKADLDDRVGRLIAKEAGEEYVPKTKDSPASHRLSEWHVHDLRASAASMMEVEPLSIDQRTISRVLGHSKGGKSTTRKYLRHGFDREAALALTRWADELAKVVGENIKQYADRRGA